jgi:hypothetical protein
VPALPGIVTQGRVSTMRSSRPGRPSRSILKACWLKFRQDGAMKISDARSFDEVLAEQLEDPEFRG